jgi:hypothetical protein
MKLSFCAACGSTDDLQHHHLVIRAEGGSDEDWNLITLCASCHAKLHERQWNGTYNHSERTKAALGHSVPLLRRLVFTGTAGQRGRYPHTPGAVARQAGAGGGKGAHLKIPRCDFRNWLG